MRRLAILFTPLLAMVLAPACSAEVAPPARTPEEPATVTVVEPPKPPAAPRQLAVAAGVFAVPLGDPPADAPLFTRIDLAADARAARCLDDKLDAAHTAFAARVGAEGRLTIVGARSSKAPPGFDDCILKVLSEMPSVAKAGPAALRVDVSVRLAGAPCDGQYCDEPATAEPAESAQGNMWGDVVGDAFGEGGLAMKGTGPGGGGTGDSIGLGSIGGIGRGPGTPSVQGFGKPGRLGGAHTTKPPTVKMGATSVSGRLPPEVIQRIVRQNFGRFRLCYENGLRSKPDLVGMVGVFFQINKDGSVSKVASNKSTDLPDAGVVSCILKAFHGLSFPKPEGGIVTVTYPIKFSPGGEEKPPTIAGKRFHELAASDVAGALAAKGWKPSIVSASDAPGASTPFVVFAEKDGGIAFVTRHAGNARKPHELSVSADGFTIAGDSLTRKPASGLREIVQR